MGCNSSSPADVDTTTLEPAKTAKNTEQSTAGAGSAEAAVEQDATPREVSPVAAVPLSSDAATAAVLKREVEAQEEQDRQQEAALVKLQALHRGRAARAQVAAMKEERAEQQRAEAAAEAEREAREAEEARAAAEAAEAAAREAAAAAEAAKKAEEEAAVVLLQARARGLVARREADERRKQRAAAAEAEARAAADAEEAERQRAEEEKAAREAEEAKRREEEEAAVAAAEAAKAAAKAAAEEEARMKAEAEAAERAAAEAEAEAKAAEEAAAAAEAAARAAEEAAAAEAAAAAKAEAEAKEALHALPLHAAFVEFAKALAPSDDAADDDSPRLTRTQFIRMVGTCGLLDFGETLTAGKAGAAYDAACAIEASGDDAEEAAAMGYEELTTALSTIAHEMFSNVDAEHAFEVVSENVIAVGLALADHSRAAHADGSDADGSSSGSSADEGEHRDAGEPKATPAGGAGKTGALSAGPPPPAPPAVPAARDSVPPLPVAAFRGDTTRRPATARSARTLGQSTARTKRTRGTRRSTSSRASLKGRYAKSLRTAASVYGVALDRPGTASGKRRGSGKRNPAVELQGRSSDHALTADTRTQPTKAAFLLWVWAEAVKHKRKGTKLLRPTADLSAAGFRRVMEESGLMTISEEEGGSALLSESDVDGLFVHGLEASSTKIELRGFMRALHRIAARISAVKGKDEAKAFSEVCAAVERAAPDSAKARKGTKVSLALADIDPRVNESREAAAARAAAEAARARASDAWTALCAVHAESVARRGDAAWESGSAQRAKAAFLTFAGRGRKARASHRRATLSADLDREGFLSLLEAAKLLPPGEGGRAQADTLFVRSLTPGFHRLSFTEAMPALHELAETLRPELTEAEQFAFATDALVSAAGAVEG